MTPLQDSQNPAIFQMEQEEWIQPLQEKQEALGNFVRSLPQRIQEVLPLAPGKTSPDHPPDHPDWIYGSILDAPHVRITAWLCEAITQVCAHDYVLRKILFAFTGEIREFPKLLRKVIPLGLEVRLDRDANPPKARERWGLSATLSVAAPGRPLCVCVPGLNEEGSINDDPRSPEWNTETDKKLAAALRDHPGPAADLGRECEDWIRKTLLEGSIQEWGCRIMENTRAQLRKDSEGRTLLRVAHRQDQHWKSQIRNYDAEEGHWRDHIEGEFSRGHEIFRIQDDGELIPLQADRTEPMPLRFAAGKADPRRPLDFFIQSIRPRLRDPGDPETESGEIPESEATEWRKRNRETLSALRKQLNPNVLRYIGSSGKGNLTAYRIAFPAFQKGLDPAQKPALKPILAELCARENQTIPERALEFQRECRTRKNLPEQSQAGFTLQSLRLHKGESFAERITKESKSKGRRKRYRMQSALCALRAADPKAFEREARRGPEAMLQHARSLSGGGLEFIRRRPKVQITLDPDCVDFETAVQDHEEIIFDLALARCLRRGRNPAWSWKRPQAAETILAALSSVCEEIVWATQEAREGGRWHAWRTQEQLAETLLASWIAQNPVDGEALEDWAFARAESEEGFQLGLRLQTPREGEEFLIGTSPKGEEMHWIQHVFQGFHEEPGMMERVRSRELYWTRTRKPGGGNTMLVGFEPEFEIGSGKSRRINRMILRHIRYGEEKGHRMHWSSLLNQRGNQISESWRRPEANNLRAREYDIAGDLIQILNRRQGWRASRRPKSFGPAPETPESIQALLSACAQAETHPIRNGHPRLKENPAWTLHRQAEELSCLEEDERNQQGEEWAKGGIPDPGELLHAYREGPA